jgi:hypothetical protein
MECFKTALNSKSQRVKLFRLPVNGSGNVVESKARQSFDEAHD